MWLDVMLETSLPCVLLATNGHALTMPVQCAAEVRRTFDLSHFSRWLFHIKTLRVLRSLGAMNMAKNE